MKKIQTICGFIILALGLVTASRLSAQDDKAYRFEHLMKEAKDFSAQVSVDLGDWELFGRGELVFDESEGAFMLTETPGSVGVTIISPDTYGRNVTVTFLAKPLKHASVNVVMLNVSEVSTGGDIVVPYDYDGNYGFWTDGTVQNYLFAFHNAAHDSLPFIIKCPGRVKLAKGEKHYVEPGRWQKVEISRKGSKLSLKVNGITVVEAVDQDSETAIQGGRVCLRLRGTADDLASCLFKNVEITE